MNRMQLLFVLGTCAALLGCASTQVEHKGAGLQAPLCQPGGEPLSALVYWEPQWRPDQKEPARREAAALRGIQDFFASTGCIAHADIRRLPHGLATAAPTDAQLVQWAGGVIPAPDRVLLIVVRELGPTLRIGLPVLVEGGTEVVIDVRVLHARTAAGMANVRTHWQHGGTLVVKGGGTLAQDMAAALGATLLPPAQTRANSEMEGGRP